MVTWKNLVIVLVSLSLLRGAVILLAQVSPRKYDAATVEKYFTGAYLEKAAVYKERRLQVQRYATPVGIVTDLLFIFAGPLPWLNRRLAATRLPRLFQGVMLIAALLLFSALVRLPFSYKFGYLLEKEFGFSNQSGAGFLSDYAKETALELVFAAIATGIFLWCYGKFRRGWIWFTGSAFTLLMVFTTYIMPVVVEPMFFDYKPLPQDSLRRRIEKLATAANLPLDNILEMKASEKTNRTNAYVSGLWRTHNVVLFDTLRKKLSEDEIISIVGHEFGHSALGHVWKGLLLAIAAIWIAVLAAAWLIRRLAQIYPAEIHGRHIAVLIPVLLLIFNLGLFGVYPVLSALSRRQEAQADFYSLQATRNPAAAIRMEIKLTEDNLSDPNPRILPYIWYASHPDPIARIRQAEEFR